MRTIFTLLIASLMTISAQAANEGRLTLSFSGNTNVNIQVDGRYYPVRNNMVSIDRIPAGRHSIRVFQSRGGGSGSGRLLYQGQVNVRPYYDVDVTFNRFGKAFFDEQRYDASYNPDTDAWGNGGWQNGNNGGWNDGSSGWNGGGGNNGNGWGNGGWNNGNGSNNGNWGNNYNTMSAASFSALLTQLRAESFDNTKLTLAKDALAVNWVNALQVKQLMQLFTFDNDRLALAKAAYPRTADKNNYFQVMDAFEFSSSKEQLSAWVRTQ